MFARDPSKAPAASSTCSTIRHSLLRMALYEKDKSSARQSMGKRDERIETVLTVPAPRRVSLYAVACCLQFSGCDGEPLERVNHREIRSCIDSMASSSLLTGSRGRQAIHAGGHAHCLESRRGPARRELAEQECEDHRAQTKNPPSFRNSGLRSAFGGESGTRTPDPRIMIPLL